MKHLFKFALVGFVLILGCNTEDDSPNMLSVLGEWELAEVGFQWQADPDDFELPIDRYQFNQNNTFSRTTESDSGVKNASGTYVIEPATDEDVNALFYITLDYEQGEEMIGNCEGGGYEEGKEYLFINSEKRLRNTWDQCDGPSYIYDKNE